MAEALQISVVLDAVDRMTAPMRAALGANQQLADSLAATRRRLAELDQAGKNLNAYNKLKEQLASLSPRMDAAQGRLAALQQQMNATANPSERLTQQFNRAQAAVERLSQSQARLVSRLDQTENRLTAAGVSVQNVTTAEQQLNAATAAANHTLTQQATALNHVMQRQTALTNHQRAMTTARSRMQDSLQLQQDVAGVAYPALAAGTGMLYAAARPVMQAANLSDMTNDIAITGNMGKADETALREQLRKVAVDRNQLQETVGHGVQILVANGMDAKSAADYADMLGKAATASRADMSDLSNVTFTLQNNMKIQGKDEMEKAMNNLVHAGKQGQFELKEMARYFPSMAAQMASMGGTGQESVKELGIAMQAARKAAGTSGEAAANMANWFSHMTAGSTQDHFASAGINLQQEMLKRMNAKDPTQRMGAFRASLDVFDQYIDKITAGKTVEIKDKKGKVKESLNFRDALAKAKAGGNEAEVRSIVERFGLSEIIQDMQTANFYLAMRQNKDFIKNGMASFDSEEAKNTLNTDFDKRMESPIEQFKTAKIAFADTLTQMGDTILPMITPLIQQVTQITQSITAWAKANPELTATLIKIAAVVGVAMAAFGGIAMTIISVLGPLAMFRYALGMVRLQFAFFAGGGRAFSWIRGVLPSLTALRGVLGSVGNAILSFGRALGSGLLSAGTRLLGMVRSLIPSWSTLASGARLAGQAILWLGRAMLANPIVLIATAIAGVAYLIYKNWATIKPLLANFWNSVKAAWSGFKAWVMSLISSISTTFSNGWNTIKSNTAAFANSFVGFFASLPGKMMAVGTEIINGLWQGLKSKMAGVLNSVSEFAGQIADKAKSVLGINSPSRVFMEIGGWTAEGLGMGLLQGQPQLMQYVTNLATALPQPVRDVVRQAANDPELQPFSQPAVRHGNVIPLPTRANTANTAINQNITIAINAAAGMDERAIAEAVSRKLREHQREAAAKARGRMYD